MDLKTFHDFLDYYEKVRLRTKTIVGFIPPDKMDWTYKKGKFTLADLIRHGHSCMSIGLPFNYCLKMLLDLYSSLSRDIPLKERSKKPDKLIRQTNNQHGCQGNLNLLK